MRSLLSRHSEKLHYFMVLSQKGSIGAAARSLGMATGSLSTSLRDLEVALKVQLFERSYKGITLTSAGTELSECCGRIFRDLEETEFRMLRLNRTNLVPVRIGVFESIALALWPCINKELNKSDNSWINLRLRTGRSSTIVECLLGREVDIGIFVECAQHAELQYRTLLTDTYDFFVRSTDKCLQKGNISQQEVSQRSCILIPDAMDQEGVSLQEHLSKNRLFFANEITLDSLEVAAKFVMNGMGVGLLPVLFASQNSAQLKKISIDQMMTPIGPHRIFFAYRSDSDLRAHAVETIFRAVTQAASGYSSGE